MASTIVLQDISPNGNIRVVVEQCDRVVFVYVQGAEDAHFGSKACWLRNLEPAPESLDVDSMKKGQAPMLPATQCKHPAGEAAFVEGQLRAVWFEEGEGVAILEGDEILAIIPPWAGTDGFDGFARDCIETTPLCWELKSDNVLIPRIQRAENYWSSWDEEPTPWQTQSALMMQEMESQLGKHSRYFAIDGGEWPPKALALFEREAFVAMVSLGVSLRPQPAVEMAVEEPNLQHRIELAFAFDSTLDPEKMLVVGNYISGQSNLPWEQSTWLGDWHTVPCREFADIDTKMTAMLLVKRDLDEVLTLQLSPYRNDPINVLWCVPITSAEREFAAERGSELLLARLRGAGVTRVYRDRACTIS